MNPENIKVTSGRDSNYKSTDIKSRGNVNAKSQKDFKKILQNVSDNEDEIDSANEAGEVNEEASGGLVKEMEDNNKKQAPLSLFDLTSGKTVDTSDTNKSNRLAQAPSPVQSPAPTTQSPATIYSQLTSETKKIPKEQPLESSDKFTTRFSTEQTDLSYINPLAANANQMPSVNLSISNEKAIVPVKDLQAIINQMVDKVTEMKSAGTTETVITLKNIPLFKEATIVVTAFDSAKNEFNITIENLTQAGKQMMDQQNNRDSLLSSLQQKGYAVHILSTTTLTETRPIMASLPEDEQRRQPDDEKEQNQRQRQRRGQG